MSACDDLLRELSEGQCCCVLPTPSGMISVDPLKGTLRYHRKPQEHTVCVPCRTRKAISADGLALSEPAVAQQQRIRKVTAT